MKYAYSLQVVAVAHIDSYSPRHFHRRFFSTRDILSALVGSEINSTIFHDTMMLQFFQLMLRRFVIVYCLDDSRRAADQ